MTLRTGAAPGELLRDDGTLEQAQTKTTVLFTDVRVEEAKAVGLLDDLPGVLAYQVVSMLSLKKKKEKGK